MLLFTFCLLSIAFASNVIELTDSTFEHDTQASSGATTGSWLIDFYGTNSLVHNLFSNATLAPWCGHCKKLEKNYEKVSDELQGQVNVAKVDVPANKKTGERFGIKGFPTILMIDQGKVYTFQGERSVKGLLAFAKVKASLFTFQTLYDMCIGWIQAK